MHTRTPGSTRHSIRWPGTGLRAFWRCRFRCKDRNAKNTVPDLSWFCRYILAEWLAPLYFGGLKISSTIGPMPKFWSGKILTCFLIRCFHYHFVVSIDIKSYSNTKKNLGLRFVNVLSFRPMCFKSPDMLLWTANRILNFDDGLISGPNDIYRIKEHSIVFVISCSWALMSYKYNNIYEWIGPLHIVFVSAVFCLSLCQSQSVVSVPFRSMGWSRWSINWRSTMTWANSTKKTRTWSGRSRNLWRRNSATQHCLRRNEIYRFL